MSLSISPRLIIEAAQKRGWHVRIVDEARSLYRIDVSDSKYYYVRNISSIKSGMVNTVIADNKDLFFEVMTSLAVPLPATLTYTGDTAQAEEFLLQHGSIVVKPTNLAHGKGITTGITSTAQLQGALSYAATFSKKSLLQQHIEGDDYRLLMIDGELAAAAIRKPAFVIGDGRHTVSELIKLENDSDRRTNGYQVTLTTIDVATAARYLGGKMHAIPGAGVETRVIDVANIGRGGVAIDVTDTVNPQLVSYAKIIIDHLHIGLCGVDFIVTPSGEMYLIEINVGPSLGLHEYPYQGTPRHTPDKFLDWLSKE